MEELIYKSFQRRTSPEEEDRLRAWRSASPENERRYRALRDLWKLTGSAAPPDSFGAPPEVSEILEGARRARDSEMERAGAVAGPGHGPLSDRERGDSGCGGRWWARRVAVGGLAAGLVALGLALGSLAGDEERAPSMLADGEIVTGHGEKTTITLADGSSIRLGPRSRLRLSESEHGRSAWLEGRAFFGVQADSVRPFVVHTEEGRAEALGTRFEVRTDREFRVLVVEGQVSVNARGAEVAVSSGQMSRSRGGKELRTEEVEDVFRHLRWLGDAVVFNATPLQQVAEELERRYDVRVAIEDPALLDFAVTAAFTGERMENVVRVICETIGASCVVDGDDVMLRSGSVKGR